MHTDIQKLPLSSEGYLMWWAYDSRVEEYFLHNPSSNLHPLNSPVLSATLAAPETNAIADK